MSGNQALSHDLAAELRGAFDRSFAEPRPPAPPPSEDLLAIRAGAEPFALRLSEIAGLYADRKITALPGGVVPLLGITGLRGAIVAVYDLAAVLGVAPVHPAAPPARWLVMAAGRPVAFAFAGQEGLLRVPHTAMAAQDARQGGRRHVREFARIADGVRPIVELSSVLAALQPPAPATLDTENR